MLDTNLDESSKEIFEAVQTAIGHYANVEPEDVSITDHLQKDLFIDLSRDLPKIIAHIMTELDIVIDPDLITDFIGEAEDDDLKATVAELVAFIKDEVDFS